MNFSHFLSFFPFSLFLFCPPLPFLSHQSPPLTQFPLIHPLFIPFSLFPPNPPFLSPIFIRFLLSKSFYYLSPLFPPKSVNKTYMHAYSVWENMIYTSTNENVYFSNKKSNTLDTSSDSTKSSNLRKKLKSSSSTSFSRYGHVLFQIYPKCINNYAPLRKLLLKDSKFKWNNTCEDAFKKLKNKISNDQVLTPYKTELLLIVACDASPTGIAEILSHIIDDSEKPIAFASIINTCREKL